MKRNNLFNKIFSGSVILSLCLIPLNLTSCSKRNPHEYIKSKDVINSINSIRRLDKDGKLYFMENTMDYRNNKEIVSTIEDWEWNEKIDMNFGCSVFMTPSISNDIETTLTGRAYDLLHLYKDINENIKLGNTNLMIHTPKDESKGIYHESIGTCDALIFYPEKLTFEEVDAGLLDNQKTDLSYLALSPYYTVDGINDAGLTASILILANEGDIPKENIIEQKDAKKIKKTDTKIQMSTVRAVRHILDNCSSVEEAEKEFEKIYVKRDQYHNFHIFVTDKDSNSRLFEWFDIDLSDDFQQFISIDTNVATNFYQAFTTAPEYATKLTHLKRKYTYGYWRAPEAYDRFNAIASILDFYTIPGGTTPILSKQQADSLLRVINVNDTLFSNLFNSTELTQSLYVNQDLSKKYVYSLKQHKFIS